MTIPDKELAQIDAELLKKDRRSSNQIARSFNRGRSTIINRKEYLESMGHDIEPDKGVQGGRHKDQASLVIRTKDIGTDNQFKESSPASISETQSIIGKISRKIINRHYKFELMQINREAKTIG